MDALSENFTETIAQLLSRALTNDEVEALLKSFPNLQARLRQMSADNLQKLEVRYCKHSNSCTSNCLTGFVRTFVITYTFKYGLALLPALLTGKLFKNPKLFITYGGRDTTSFALFLASFISSYKGLLCGLRHARSTNDSLNAFVAGSIAGCSLLLDSNRSRRIMIALYLSTRTGHFLCRWTWRTFLARRFKAKSIAVSGEPLAIKLNALVENGVVKAQPLRLQKEFDSMDSVSEEIVKSPADPSLPDQDDLYHTHHPFRYFLRQLCSVLVMMFASARVLNAFVLAPDSLSKSYLSFLMTHGGVRALQPKRGKEYLYTVGPVIRTSCSAVDDQVGKFLPGKHATFADSLHPLLDAKKIGQFAETLSSAPHKFVMCAFQHPFQADCWSGFYHSVLREFQTALKLYMPLNAIMTLVFRRKQLVKAPVMSLRSFIVSSIRSATFLTTYVAIAWCGPCAFRWLRNREEFWMYYLHGILAGASILIEVPSRRLELGLYCLPRALESLWNSLVEQGYVFNLPLGEVTYFSVATGALMSLYQNDPSSIHQGYRKIMFRIFGIN